MNTAKTKNQTISKYELCCIAIRWIHPLNGRQYVKDRACRYRMHHGGECGVWGRLLDMQFNVATGVLECPQKKLDRFGQAFYAVWLQHLGKLYCAVCKKADVFLAINCIFICMYSIHI